MKKFYAIILVLWFSLFIHGEVFSQLQTTWVKTLFYDTGIGSSSFYYDSLSVGPSGYAIRPDGKFFVLNMDNQHATQSIYLMDSLGNIDASMQVAHYGGLQWWKCYAIASTPDSGCVYVQHYFDFGGPAPQTMYYKLMHLDKNFTQTLVYTWQNNGMVYPPPIAEVIPNQHNSYYCRLDTNWIDIPSNDTIREKNILHVFQNDDLLVTDSTITRRNLAGSVIWTISSNGFLVVAISETSIYSTKNGQMMKIDALSGNVLWTRAKNTAGIFCSQQLTDGLASVSGRLVSVLDSSGNLVDTNTISLTYTNPRKLGSLPDGCLLTGGMFLTLNPYFPDRSFSSFIIKLNPEGHGVVDSTSFYYSGDADQDLYESYSDDAVVVVAAFGQSNSYHELNSPIHTSGFTTYSTKWATSFESGLNYKFSDTNLDGIINVGDLSILNYSGHAQNGYIWPHPDSLGEEVNIICGNSHIDIGDTITFYVAMGSQMNPIDSIYGISFEFRINGLVHLTYIEREIINGVLGDTSTNLHFFKLTNGAPYENSVVACRNDHQNISLSGDTLFRFRAVIDTFTVGGNYSILGSIHMLSKGGYTIPCHVVSNITNFTVNRKEIEDKFPFSIFPNPSNNFVNIISEKNKIDKIQLRNSTGQIVCEKKHPDKYCRLNLENLSAGFYIVQCEAAGKNYYSKLIIEY